jgi:hypothetical protein
MSCFAMDSPSKAPLAVLRTPHQRPLLHHVVEAFTKYDAIPHSTEQDALHIVFLISKQAVPYRIHGVTCYPRVSTPKIWSLADLRTTCHDGINHLHQANHYSNHNINPHIVTSHLDGWKTTTLSQRHNPNSTSQRMEDLYNTNDYRAKHN